MRTIHKYALKIVDVQQLSLPRGASVLAVQFQGKTLCLWAMGDTAAPTVTGEVTIVGTGHGCDDVDRENYVGTVQHGPMVWHLFFDPEAGREPA